MTPDDSAGRWSLLKCLLELRINFLDGSGATVVVVPINENMVVVLLLYELTELLIHMRPGH